MIIKANTLGKLLGHEPVEVAQIPGRVFNTMSMDDPLPQPTGPSIAELVQSGHLASPTVDAAELKRQRQREYNRRYQEKKKAKALALAQSQAIQAQADALGVSHQQVASDLESVRFKGLDIDQVKQQEPTSKTVTYLPPEEQRFEILEGNAAFKMARTMFYEGLLTCSMVIEGQKLQFIFTVKGKS